MPMTKKDTSRRLHQLQIEFPDEHLRKYWMDNNFTATPAELKFSVEARMRCYRKERGWHQTSDPVGPGQHFPIELRWEWYEPPL